MIKTLTARRLRDSPTHLTKKLVSGLEHVPAKSTRLLTNANYKLKHQNYLWYSIAQNWGQEYRDRLEAGIYNPNINPRTGERYTNNAQRYRHANIRILYEHPTKPGEYIDIPHELKVMR